MNEEQKKNIEYWIVEIGKIEALIKLHKEANDAFMYEQYERKKNEFVKEFIDYIGSIASTDKETLSPFLDKVWKDNDSIQKMNSKIIHDINFAL